MIWSSAILPILILSLFFLFVSSFRSGSRSSMFMFCVLKNSCRTSSFISSIAFFNCLLLPLFHSHQIVPLVVQVDLYYSFHFPVLLVLWCSLLALELGFFNLILAFSGFCCFVFIGCLIFILISSVSAAVNIFFFIISLLTLASLLASI